MHRLHFLLPAITSVLLACGGNGESPSPTSASATTVASSSSTGSGGAGGSGAPTATTTSSAGGGGAAFETAAHEAFPKVPLLGGPVLAHPHIVTITFAGYPFEADAQSFGDFIPTSSWLTTTGKDYGGSAGVSAAKVVIAGAAPASASDAQTAAFITAKIADKTLPDPTTLEDALYVVYYPHETAVTNFLGTTACSANLTVGGYHWETTAGATKIAYAVVPTCGTTADALGYVEASTGHEIIEAATDPYPNTKPGYGIPLGTNPWAALDGEIADLCQFEGYDKESGFYVPRIWSNSAALADGDPCVPVPADETAYYNTSPSPTGIVTVAAGESATFTMTGWSTAPLPAWTLDVVPWGDFNAKPTLSGKSISNGETVTLTMSVPAGTPPGKQSNVLVYSIQDLKAFKFNYWPVVIRSK